MQALRQSRMSSIDRDAALRVAGIDFTSRPRRAKPITVALGRRVRDAVVLERLEAHLDNGSLVRFLRTPGPWVAAFDFPFGLPRELVETLGWPRTWPELMRHYGALTRAEIRTAFAAFCAARPVGGKFAHRGCDAGAGSSSPMKWVNPPVAYMLHAGVPLLLESGLHLPHLHPGDETRIALEGYPGLLAREVIGRRSYKHDARAGDTADRRAARVAIVDALARGDTRLALRLVLEPMQRRALVDERSADQLDAVLCLMQAAWAAGQPNHGLPVGLDPIEGWIVSTPVDSSNGAVSR